MSATRIRPALEVVDLEKRFQAPRDMLGRRGPPIRAVDRVSFTLSRGETVALVGESGSGKSTLGRAILQLDRPTSGQVIFDGTDLVRLSDHAMRPFRRRMQMIFQDPHASLNPRMSIREIVGEPMVIHGLFKERGARERRIASLLDMVGLPRAAADRYPREFSGGQRQRIGIARAIAVDPEMIIADEAVSALDVSIQAQIINLLGTLQQELQLAHLFIAHDLSVVRHIADRVLVMYLGKVVEMGSSEIVLTRPAHPYTRMLLEAAPIPDPARERERRRVASLSPRIDWRQSYTAEMASMPLVEVGPGHFAAILPIPSSADALRTA